MAIICYKTACTYRFADSHNGSFERYINICNKQTMGIWRECLDKFRNSHQTAYCHITELIHSSHQNRRLWLFKWNEIRVRAKKCEEYPFNHHHHEASVIMALIHVNIKIIFVTEKILEYNTWIFCVSRFWYSRICYAICFDCDVRWISQYISYTILVHYTTNMLLDYS